MWKPPLVFFVHIERPLAIYRDRHCFATGFKTAEKEKTLEPYAFHISEKHIAAYMFFFL